MQVGFSAVGIDSGTTFSEIDLSSKVKAIKSWSKHELLYQEWTDYDEKAGAPVSIFEVEHLFKKF